MDRRQISNEIQLRSHAHIHIRSIPTRKRFCIITHFNICTHYGILGLIGTYVALTSQSQIDLTSRMPNQLPLPFKKTYIVPIRQAARDYISSHYADTHPDAYRWDIGHWEKLRAEATSGGIHVDRINAMIRFVYHIAHSLTECSRRGNKLPCTTRVYLDEAAS